MVESRLPTPPLWVLVGRERSGVTLYFPGWLPSPHCASPQALVGATTWPEIGSGVGEGPGALLARMTDSTGWRLHSLLVLASFPLSSVTSLGCREGGKFLGKTAVPRKSVYLISEKISGKLSKHRERFGGAVHGQSLEATACPALDPGFYAGQ